MHNKVVTHGLNPQLNNLNVPNTSASTTGSIGTCLLWFSGKRDHVQCRCCEDMGSILGLGLSPWRREWPAHSSDAWRISHGQMSLWAAVQPGSKVGHVSHSTRTWPFIPPCLHLGESSAWTWSLHYPWFFSSFIKDVFIHIHYSLVLLVLSLIETVSF